MMKNALFLLLCLFYLCACNDDDATFIASKDGLEVTFKPVAGGAVMYYTLPNNSEIFAMNVRYTDWQGEEVLKSCGYGGDSILLDGFTKSQEAQAYLSFVNNNNQETEAFTYSFNTLDSAPWAIFEDIEVSPSWGGFQVIYKSPSVVTGMAHIFYLGINPKTQQEDTILLTSFPLLQGGDTLNFTLQQKRDKNTVIIRTEDFQGYRVRQEIYPDIDAFLFEQWPMTAENFNDFGLSMEDPECKLGIQYLFDGELLGRERFIASANENPAFNPFTTIFATYLAGPYAFGKPIVIDLREQKTPAWIRLYSMRPMYAKYPSGFEANGFVWKGRYDDKIPCKVKLYGSKASSDPYSDEWVFLGQLKQDPEADTPKERWSYDNMEYGQAPQSLEELLSKDPIYVDILCPANNNTYRYLKIVVDDTFRRKAEVETNYNEEQYFSLHELEVFVKK